MNVEFRSERLICAVSFHLGILYGTIILLGICPFFDLVHAWFLFLGDSSIIIMYCVLYLGVVLEGVGDRESYS